MTQQTLKDLPVGATAVIAQLDPNLPEYSTRLMGLGLLPGVEVEILRLAPLGDPVQIKALDSFFALRAREMAAIIITNQNTGVNNNVNNNTTDQAPENQNTNKTNNQNTATPNQQLNHDLSQKHDDKLNQNHLNNNLADTQQNNSTDN